MEKLELKIINKSDLELLKKYNKNIVVTESDLLIGYYKVIINTITDTIICYIEKDEVKNESWYQKNIFII